MQQTFYRRAGKTQDLTAQNTNWTEDLSLLVTSTFKIPKLRRKERQLEELVTSIELSYQSKSPENVSASTESSVSVQYLHKT